MSPSAVRVEVRPDRVAVLTIDQPGRAANVLTPELWAELDAALAALETESGVRGLVIASGKPGVFIAGADLKFFLNLPGPNDPTCRAYVEQGLAVLDRLERQPFPTCAAIDGAALGGGLEVALACDFRVCGTNPRVELGLPEVTLGLIPGWGGTQRLPRIVGLSAAENLLRYGFSVCAIDARRCGLLISRDDSSHLIDVASRSCLENLDTSAIRDPKQLPVGGDVRSKFEPLETSDVSTAVQEIVSVLVRGAALPLADAIRLETEAFLRLAGSDESKRLIAEFFARRKKS